VVSSPVGTLRVFLVFDVSRLHLQCWGVSDWLVTSMAPMYTVLLPSGYVGILGPSSDSASFVRPTPNVLSPRKLLLEPI